MFEFDLSDPEELYSKASHTLSAFLLGMCFKKLVKKETMRILGEKAHRFEYPWFLCCLYHDTYSVFEKKHKTTPCSLEEMIKEMDIEYEIYKTDNAVFSGLKEWPITYKRDTVERYYDERLKRGSVDHGILSGFYGFDRLVKNYIEARKKDGDFRDWFTTPPDAHDSDSYKLIWNREQISVFALAADAIIAHNIWHLPNIDIPEVRRDDYNPEEKKLSIKETPLAYFLSLIDTIEPIKYFTSDAFRDKYGIKYTDGDILSGFNMSLFNNEIVIIGNIDFQQFKDWYDDKIKDIGNWLEGTEEDDQELENKIIRIKLPSKDLETEI